MAVASAAEIQAKIARLQSKKKTSARIVGGVRVKPKIVSKAVNHNQVTLDRILSKMPFTNVNQPIEKIEIYLMDQQKITIDHPIPGGITGHSKLRYLEKFNCFILNLSDQNVVKETLDEELKNPVIGRVVNRPERKFKDELAKKCQMKKGPPVAQIDFTMPGVTWKLFGPELYSIGNSYYVMFGQIQITRPEELVAQEEFAKATQIEDQVENNISEVREEVVPESKDQPVTEVVPESEEQDIQMIMQESGVSREKASEALATHGDMVDALMSLMS